MLLFHYAMLRYVGDLPRLKGFDDGLKYYLIGRQEQDLLSKRLRLPISRVKTLIDKSASLYGREPTGEEFRKLLADLVQRAHPGETWHKNGQVGVVVHNKPLKELIVTRLDAIRTFADYSFNSDLLRIHACDLLTFVGKDSVAAIKSLVEHAKTSSKLSADDRAKLAPIAVAEIRKETRRDTMKKMAAGLGPVIQTVLGSFIA